MDPLETGQWSEISTLGTFKNMRGGGAVGSEAEWKQLGKQSTGLGDRLGTWWVWGTGKETLRLCLSIFRRRAFEVEDIG